MRKDPTEFRARFKSYKEGKMPYENGLPKYLDGKRPMSYWDKKQSTSYRIPFIPEKQVKLTNAGLATGAVLSTNLLDSIADNAYAAGLPIETALGLAVKESTLGNPTDDRSAWNLSSHIRRLFNNVYPGTVLHINKGEVIDPVALINYYKGDIDYEWRDLPNQYGELFSLPVKNQSVLKTGFEFYKQHPNKYNPGQPGHQKAVDARGDEVMNSPEVKKWYKEWEAKQMKIMRSKPYKILTNILNTAAPKFGSWKNGKLPEYRGGKIVHNVSHAEMNNDGTFIDDYTKVFEDMYVTPQKTDLKRGSYTLNNFPYYLQHRTDWMRPFMSSSTNEKGLELTHPEFDVLSGVRMLQQLQTPFTKINLGTPQLKSEVFQKVPKNHKYLYNSSRNYGTKINYKSPQDNILTVELLDLMLGEYLGRGAERMVFEDRRNPNRVIKIGGGLNAEQNIKDFDALNEAVEYTLEMNKLPGTAPISYEGFILEGDKFIPWFSLLKVIPMKKMADPWRSFTKPYILPNGKPITKGKLSAIRFIDDSKTVNKLGYIKNPNKKGLYDLPGYPYLVGDFGEKNMGFDELGNLKIFDPLIEL